jgi:riboflavin synthase
MFSGIVEEKGVVTQVKKKANLYTMTIRAKRVVRGTRIGDSIAVNGVCLTVTKKTKNLLTFDLMKETLDATTLKWARPGKDINLERALKVNARLGGHFVSGHVDGVGRLERIVHIPNYVEWQISLDKDLATYLAPKGSVCIDGVSLTIGWVKKNLFSIYLIPHTLDVTTFGRMRQGQELNIETDLLAKYILQNRQTPK